MNVTDLPGAEAPTKSRSRSANECRGLSRGTGHDVEGHSRHRCSGKKPVAGQDASPHAVNLAREAAVDKLRGETLNTQSAARRPTCFSLLPSRRRR